MIAKKRWRYLWLGVLLLVWAGAPTQTQMGPAPTSEPGRLVTAAQYIRSDRLGITFISSTNDQSAERYRNALILGAGWNRWPLYWYDVETSPTIFDWSRYDSLVRNDIANRLNINAILLGRPEFYRDGGSIAGINEPIFADGTDIPRGQAINPNNPWARWVYEAVLRYKPNGILARQSGWRGGEGIRVWEVWNEPDHAPFWEGGVTNYARLLKVSYLVIKQADPEATVLFGGLLYSTDNNWLSLVMNIYAQNDPFVIEHNWYHDAVAIHSYNYPWRSGWLALVARQTYRAFETAVKPIWLNETGVSVWDDYPGPVWAQDPSQRVRLATTEQQAWYFIQSAAYAWSEGVDKVFFHQLYDDCGNQPAGTNFPPHNGELCVGGGNCFGDAFGIYRNPPTSVCFSQHPLPNTPRPVAAAYRLLAEHFGREPFVADGRETVDNSAIVIRFRRPQTGERLVVMWNKTLEEYTLSLPSTADKARLYTLGESYDILPGADRAYGLRLPPAVPDNYPNLNAGDVTAIGGAPFILVESEAPPALLPDLGIQGASGTLARTPGPVIPPPSRPTVDPSADTTPPSAQVEALPALSPSTFTVRWRGADDSGIARYLIWVQVDGGDWSPWLETTRTSAEYTGEAERSYAFAAWAVDLAGNWSANTDLQPQATTRVE